jgi:hypothetical protein
MLSLKSLGGSSIPSMIRRMALLSVRAQAPSSRLRPNQAAMLTKSGSGPERLSLGWMALLRSYVSFSLSRPFSLLLYRGFRPFYGTSEMVPDNMPTLESSCLTSMELKMGGMHFRESGNSLPSFILLSLGKIMAPVKKVVWAGHHPKRRLLNGWSSKASSTVTHYHKNRITRPLLDAHIQAPLRTMSSTPLRLRNRHG